MRHGPAVCTVTVCCPSGIPLPHIQVPITLLTHDTEKKLQTQAAITGRTKASSPDLQSTGNSKVAKGVIHLFF